VTSGDRGNTAGDPARKPYRPPAQPKVVSVASDAANDYTVTVYTDGAGWYASGPPPT